MNLSIKKGVVIALALALLSVAGIVFYLGKKSSQSPAGQEAANTPAVPTPEEVPLSPIRFDKSGVYTNEVYGLKIRDKDQKEFVVLECPLVSKMAYNPVVEIVLTRQETSCSESQDRMADYMKAGLVAHFEVYDLAKCDQPTPDRKEDATGDVIMGDVEFCQEAKGLPESEATVIPGKETGTQVLPLGTAIRHSRYMSVLSEESKNVEFESIAK